MRALLKKEFIERDSIKNQYCFDNDIKLYRLGYKEFDILEDVLNFFINKKKT